MTGPVLVIAGQWECGIDGSWNFLIEKDIMAQCLILPEDMTFDKLKTFVETVFNISGERMAAQLSFWMPSQMSCLASHRAPSVCVMNDVSLDAFRLVRSTAPDLNLFVSFGIPDIDLNAVPGVRKKGSGSATAATHKDNWVDGVINIGEDSVSDDECVVPTGIPLSVHEAGTIDHNAGPPYFDDELAAHVAKLDAVQAGVMESGSSKGKCILLESSSEETAQDGSSSDGSMEWSCSEDYDFDYWDALIDKENRELASQPILNLDDVETARHPQQEKYGVQHANSADAEEGQAAQRVGEHNVEINEQNLEEGDIQSAIAAIQQQIHDTDVMPTQDARPVFEDDFVLTAEAGAVDYGTLNDAIYIGRVFANKEEMQHVMAHHAIRRMFAFKQDKSDTTRVILSCVDPNCRWRVFGKVVSQYSNNIKVQTARLTHTCDVSTRSQYGRHCTARVIGEVLKTRYLNGNKGPRAYEIPEIVLRELKVSISYMKAWYAKEEAMRLARGSEEGSYKLLSGYMEVMAKYNPGTEYMVMSVTGRNGVERFKYVFFALGASIAAIPYLRKVVIIDGTAIKAKFKGTLLTASFQDGNYQIFPLGFAVVDGENESAWKWFLKQLKIVLPDSSELMFVSDRHGSIYKAIEEMYPLANHGVCSVHLYRNVKSKFKGDGLGYLFSKAARAYYVPEFDRWFNEIERRCPPCADYLRAIGFRHWSQCYSGGRRYNLSSSNVAETLNSSLAKALQLPIVSMIETIRMTMMQWFYWRHEAAKTATTTLTPAVEKMLMNELMASSNHHAIPTTPHIYQVNTPEGKMFIVNLAEKTCTCRAFDILGTPCSHALAAGRVIGLPVPYMCEEQYTVENTMQVYKGVVMPVPTEGGENAYGNSGADDIVHPESARGACRPRKRRIPSAGEHVANKKKRNGYRCSRCLQNGHNKATCQSVLN